MEFSRIKLLTHIILAFGWNHVITSLNRPIVVLLVVGFEPGVVGQDGFPIRLFVINVFEVIPLDRFLAWLQSRIRFVSVSSKINISWK
jgi:hypothetical protein